MYSITVAAPVHIYISYSMEITKSPRVSYMSSALFLSLTPATYRRGMNDYTSVVEGKLNICVVVSMFSYSTDLATIVR